jgi:hypothetical protein
MVQGGFYETKRMKPGTVAIVVLLHGAAITAAMLAKEGLPDRLKPTITQIDLIDPPKPRPEKRPPPKPQSHQQETPTTVPTADPPPIPTWPVPPPPPGPAKVDSLPGPTTVEGPLTAPPPLDLATCRVMKARARFAPARDTGGNAVADAVSSAIVWRLPTG